MTSREVLDAEMRGALKGFRMGTNQDSDRFNAYFGGLSDAYDALPDEPQAEPVTEPRLLVDLSQFEPIGDGQWILDLVRKQREWLVTDGKLCERAYSWKSSKGLRWTALPYQPCQECQCEDHVYSPTVYIHFTPTHARPVEVTT